MGGHGGLPAPLRAHRERPGEVNPAEALKVIKAGGGLFRVMPQVASAFARAPDLGLMPASANDEGGEPVDPTTAVPSSDASSESDTTPPPPGA